MPDSVKTIGESAFESCKKLEFIRLSNKLTLIPKSMLEYCKFLREIIIPEGVTSIERAAFANCDWLEKIVLPSTINRIDKGGTWGLNPFQYNKSLKQIVVPKDSKRKIQSLLQGFSGNPANLLVWSTEEKKELKKSPTVKTTKGSSCSTKLPMEDIMKAANSWYPKESLKSLAVAALKIAEVIEERLPDADVSYMVHPSEFDPSVNKEALPIHFLFKKDGNPVVAVVAVTSYGYNATHVIETADACENNGIGYVRVFADGYYADWIQGWSTVTNGPVSQESVDFCKDWLVDKISQYL